MRPTLGHAIRDRVFDAALLGRRVGRRVRDVRTYSGTRADRMDPLEWAAHGLATRDERLGGTGVDYQFAEEEVAAGLARLVVRVAPGVGPLDEARLREALESALENQGPTTSYHAAICGSAKVIEVFRKAPRPTAAEKVLPLQIAARRD